VARAARARWPWTSPSAGSSHRPASTMLIADRFLRSFPSWSGAGQRPSARATCRSSHRESQRGIPAASRRAGLQTRPGRRWGVRSGRHARPQEFHGAPQYWDKPQREWSRPPETLGVPILWRRSLRSSPVPLPRHPALRPSLPRPGSRQKAADRAVVVVAEVRNCLLAT